MLPADVVHKIVFLQPLLQHEFSLQPIKSEVHFTNLHNTWRQALDMNNRAKHPLSTLCHLQHTNRIEYLPYPLISPLTNIRHVYILRSYILQNINGATNTIHPPTSILRIFAVATTNIDRLIYLTGLPILRTFFLDYYIY